MGIRLALDNIAIHMLTCLLQLQLSQNCAWYSLKGYVTESNPFIDNSTDIYLGAGGANLLDACGEPFNVTVTEVTQKHRYVRCPCNAFLTATLLLC